MSTIGGRFKEIRKSTNLSMEAFGKMFGITKASVSRIEAGNNGPSTALIRSVCRDLNINEVWLKTGEGEMFNDLTREAELIQFVNKMTNLDESDLKRRFFEALVQLPDEDIEYFAELVKKLGNKL